MAAISIVVATKCEPCIRGYTKMAFQAGATKEELVEFLNVAMTEAGCPGEQRVLIALEVFQQLEPGKPVNADICCHDETAN